MERLADDEIASALKDLEGWRHEHGTLLKEFPHRTFPEAIVFVNAVAHLAELANHHPDIDIRYSTIRVALVTHDANGITPRDVSLAGQIEALRQRAASRA